METLDRSTVATDLGVSSTPPPKELTLAQGLENSETFLVTSIIGPLLHF